MAASLLRRALGDTPIEVLARGFVVQFPEPMNQKAAAVLAADGAPEENFESRELKNEEITDKTLIFTMEERQRELVIAKYQAATEENTFVLTKYVGEELETMNPYGGALAAYGVCYETLRESTGKLAVQLKKGQADER